MPTTTWYTVADTYISTATPSTNNGTMTTIGVTAAGSDSKFSAGTTVGLLRFHNSVVGAASVSSASLSVGWSTAGQMSVWRLLGNTAWGETTVTDSSRESLYRGNQMASEGSSGQTTYTLSNSETLGLLSGDFSGLWVESSVYQVFSAFYSRENSSTNVALQATYTTNTAPTISPVTADGQAFTTSAITLTAAVTDPDASQTLVTTFQAATDAGFTTNLVTGNAANLATPASSVNRSVSPVLADGTWYWRARVYDGSTYSSYTPTRSFTIVSNAAPTIVPSTIDNASFASVAPTLAVTVTDTDSSQTLAVTTEVWDRTETTMLWTDTKNVSTPASSVAVNFSPPTTTGTFKWRARVTDGTATSTWTAYRTYKLTNLVAGTLAADDLLVGTAEADAVFMGSDLVWERIAVPTANWIISSPSAPYRSGVSLQFTSQATRTPTAWEWDFGDGTTSTLQNPTKTYATAGARTVQHRATNVNGTSAWVSQVITVVIPEPVSSFTVGSPRQPNVAIQFTDTSTNSPTSWAWDFGDGTTSTLQNPSKTFTTENTFTVTLRATNSTGQGTLATTNVTVEAQPNYSGIVALFNTTTLPTGWVLCDGANGTQDMRDRFVVGAGSSYAVGAVGGANAVTLSESQLPSHSHNASTTSASHAHNTTGSSGVHTSHPSVLVNNSSHEHNYTGHGNTSAAFANQFANYSAVQTTQANFTSNTTEGAHATAQSASGGSHTHSTNNAGGHGHNASDNSAGSSGSHENRPPYFALVFAQATVTSVAAVGMIAMTEGAVPSGWLACDATNLPDLRDRFIVGSQLTYTLGAVGGANAVSLSTTSMPQHWHGISLGTDAGHTHATNNVSHSHAVNLSAHNVHTHGYSFQQIATITVGGNTGATMRATPSTGQITGSAGSTSHTVTWNSVSENHNHSPSNNSGNHSHSISGGNAGSGSAHENRPPYRATTFIRKTGALNEIPSGTIVMFNGTTPPSGWTVATNYYDRFPVGAGLTYTATAVGGANNVTIDSSTMPQHNHNAASDNLNGDHSHALNVGGSTHSHSIGAAHNNHTHGSMQLSVSNTLKIAGSAISAMTTSVTRSTTAIDASHSHNTTIAADNSSHTHVLELGGSHGHNASFGSAGSGFSHENRPLFRALTFIIKT